MIIPPLQGSINSEQKIVDRVEFSHSQVSISLSLSLSFYLSLFLSFSLYLSLSLSLSQTFTVEVTEDFLNHVEEGVLGVEVWGHRRSGFMDLPVPPGDPENEGKRQKSFPEKLVCIMS